MGSKTIVKIPTMINSVVLLMTISTLPWAKTMATIVARNTVTWSMAVTTSTKTKGARATTWTTAKETEAK